QYEYILIPDPDQAGEDWVEQVAKAIVAGGGSLCPVPIPEGFGDPDEAFLSGWLPDIL
ncbi:MAG: hypothetical protein HN769_02930, partial [Anaerolineae bacterium]|nr:hypothetical protein [Anaerolineae bacterium]